MLNTALQVKLQVELPADYPRLAELQGVRGFKNGTLSTTFIAGSINKVSVGDILDSVVGVFAIDLTRYRVRVVGAGADVLLRGPSAQADLVRLRKVQM